MSYRCASCNESISEADVMRQIEYKVMLECKLFEYEDVTGDGDLEPIIPERLRVGVPVVQSEQGDWYHTDCKYAWGSGITGEEWGREFRAHLYRLLNP